MTSTDKCVTSTHEHDGGATMVLRRIDPSTEKPCGTTIRIRRWFSHAPLRKEVTR